MKKVINKIGNNKQVSFDQSKQIGKNPFAVIYPGIMNTDKLQNVPVAVKLFHKNYKVLKVKNQNFQRQIQILSKLDNPYTVKLYFHYIDPQSDQFYMVYESCASSIEQQLKIKLLNSEKVFKYAYQLIQAMDYMNKQGCMHRDIKPQNIWLTQSDDIKVANFDLAKFQDNLQSLDGHTPSGTPMYASPQIANQQQYSGKCDVWSAGCLFYQMLTGKKLFAKGITMILLKKYHRQFQYPEKVKTNLQQIKDSFWFTILSKMLIYEDQERPSFSDLLFFFVEENKKHIQEQKQKSKEQIKQEKINNVKDEEEHQLIKKQKPRIKILKFNDSFEKKSETSVGSPNLSIPTRQVKTQIVQPTLSIPTRQAKTQTVSPILSIPIRQRNTKIKISPMRKMQTNLNKILLQNKKQPNIFEKASQLLDFKYFKIKLTYKYLYQFQQASKYPLDQCFFYTLAFLIILWHKTEIQEFYNQYKNESIIVQGQKLSLQISDQSEELVNKRNKIFNQMIEKRKKLMGYLKQYADFILGHNYKKQYKAIEAIHPDITKSLNQFQTVKFPLDHAIFLFKKFFKAVGLPINQIQKLQKGDQMKIYRIIGDFCLLIEKDTKFPNIAPYDQGIINQSFEEIEKMSKQAILEMVNKLD